MKNLKVLLRTKTNFEANIIANCIDADNKRYFALTEDYKILESLHDQLKAKVIEHDFYRSKYWLTNLTTQDVILMEYIVEIGSILIILSTGHFIHIGVSSFSPPSDCQYKHAMRISSVKISPDQDLIAMADIDNDLFILQMHDYANIIHSTNALCENDSLHKPVGVGWGSKETQFFGLDGRPAKEIECKLISPGEIIDDSRICESETFKSFKRAKDKSTIIDWRGDGQLIATLTYIPSSMKHYLKVWNRNLELQYMSEQLIGIEEGLLSWIPNGQYVCCGQRRDCGINDILLFEKNGMVHQRFSLPTLIQNLHIKELSWSPDSRILAILCIQFIRDDELGDVTGKSIIMLYTMQNFQCYLKYSAYLTCNVGNFLRWDPINHSKLYISSLAGVCQEADCSFTVNYTRDHSTVAVLDGNKVLITPFSICNVPPPMSAIKLELDCLIARIILSPESITDFALLTVDDRLIYVDDSGQPSEGNFPLEVYIHNEPVKNLKSQLGQLVSSELTNGHGLQNYTIIKDKVFLLATSQIGRDCQVYRIDKHGSKVSIEPLQIIKNQQVIDIAQNYKNYENNYLFMDDGTCVEMNVETGEIKPKFTLESTSDRIHILESHYVEQSGTGKVISLTQDHTLRANEHIVSSNSCTSFRISENFLIYTTTDNNLHFVPMSKVLLETIPSNLESYCQSIEAGGTLILVCENDSKVILQMPRGNIEVLHPRILVLMSVSHHLDQQNYLKALKEARRHRVDLNFLCDYLIQREGEQFFHHTLNKFALEIAEHDQSFLNLFINDLKDENTLFGRYATIMRCLPIKDMRLDLDGVQSAKGKVHKVCSSIELAGVLSPREYLQANILCLIRQEPNKVGAALQVISECDDFKSGLDFLLYYIDIEQLFNEALATYDTNLALMVANASTKDPKEYLALLDQFNEITDEYLRRYSIDVHVKNFERAFEDLLSHHIHSQKGTSHGSAVDKMLSLVESKRIYKFATRLIDEKNDLLVDLSSQLWEKYGDYLLEKRYHLEAGLAYWKAINSCNENPGVFHKSMTCLMLVEDWQRCMMLMRRTNTKNFGQLDEFTKKISDQLLARGKFTEALIVRQAVKDEHLGLEIAEKGDLNLGYILMPESHSWSPNQLIKRQISEQCVAWDSELSVAKSQFGRLKELIATYQTRRMDNLDGENCYPSDGLSTIDGSDASSILSAGTQKQKVPRSGAPSIKTRASSKSSKSKSERGKKISLKTNSRHEDIAIVLELMKFVEKQKMNQELARQMLATATVFSPISEFDQFKQSFDACLSSSLELAQEITSNLWPNNDQDAQVYSLYRRFSNLFSATEKTLENVDFLILIRPVVPKDLVLLEI